MRDHNNFVMNITKRENVIMYKNFSLDDIYTHIYVYIHICIHKQLPLSNNLLLKIIKKVHFDLVILFAASRMLLKEARFTF